MLLNGSLPPSKAKRRVEEGGELYESPKTSVPRKTRGVKDHRMVPAIMVGDRI